MRGDRLFFDGGRRSVLAASIDGLALRGPKGELRRFLEAVVWILRTGAPWRDLSARLGRGNRLYRRYRRWAVARRWYVRAATRFDKTSCSYAGFVATAAMLVAIPGWRG